MLRTAVLAAVLCPIATLRGSAGSSTGIYVVAAASAAPTLDIPAAPVRLPTCMQPSQRAELQPFWEAPFPATPGGLGAAEYAAVADELGHGRLRPLADPCSLRVAFVTAKVG